MTVHLDTDFLVYALAAAGPERRRLLDVAESGRPVEISAVAWYEFSRGPRTPEQLATARANDGGGGGGKNSNRAGSRSSRNARAEGFSSSKS